MIGSESITLIDIGTKKVIKVYELFRKIMGGAVIQYKPNKKGIMTSHIIFGFHPNVGDKTRVYQIELPSFEYQQL